MAIQRHRHVVCESSQFRAGIRAPAVGKVDELHNLDIQTRIGAEASEDWPSPAGVPPVVSAWPVVAFTGSSSASPRTTQGSACGTSAGSTAATSITWTCAYGDPHRPTDDRIELATYPETIVLTGLFTSRHWRNHPRLPAEAARRLGIAPDQLPLLTITSFSGAD